MEPSTSLSYMPTWVTDFGAIASIVGLGISLYVMRTVSTIRNRLVSRIRVPEILEKMEHYCTELNRAVATFDSAPNGVEPVLEELQALIKHVIPKLNGEARGQAKLIRNIFGKRARRPSKDWCLSVYGKIRGLLESIRQHVADQQWESEG
jgi:hypothetical protein